ncbi:hypothetical protein UFOVP87_23 [uncultured Caudovirales phage]|uniref:Uncharacterized protein n=1 Tax=uncultured Caudovirales phage TaxID=2100421 RepID=A0A6J5KWH1_9CAUD|nr:hypothetical protein UFOVP87_23 [uncultured Caudovirales phage]
MKKLITTNETATSWSPYKVETKKFLQDAQDEAMQVLSGTIIKSNLGTYSASIPYVVDGCVLSGGGTAITSGIVFYGGLFYKTTAITGATAPIEFSLVAVPDYTADPTIFSDGTSHSIHVDEQYQTFSAGASPGATFTANDLVSVYGSTTINTSTTPGTTITVNITGSGPFAYNNDNYHYSWCIVAGIVKLNFHITFDITDGAIVDKINIPLPSGLNKATTLVANNCFVGVSSYLAPTSVTDATMLLTRSNDGGGEGQRITLTRTTDGATDISISTGVTVTLKGEISFPIA